MGDRISSFFKNILIKSIKLEEFSKIDRRIFRLHQFFIAIFIGIIIDSVFKELYFETIGNTCLFFSLLMYYIFSFDCTLTKMYHLQEIEKLSDILIDLRKRGIKIN